MADGLLVRAKPRGVAVLDPASIVRSEALPLDSRLVMHLNKARSKGKGKVAQEEEFGD